MKKFNFILIISILFSSLSLRAQEKSINAHLNIGISAPLLDKGAGFNLGINPYWKFSKLIALESQVSFNHTYVSSAFLSGQKSRINSANALLGGRLYLLSEKKKVRPYVHFLAGTSYSIETKENPIRQTTDFSLGSSWGFAVEMKRINIGFSYDSPSNIIFKFGFKI